MAQPRPTFQQVFADALGKSDLGQSDIARQLGTTPSTVQAWVTGDLPCPVDALTRLEQILDMTPGALHNVATAEAQPQVGREEGRSISDAQIARRFHDAFAHLPVSDSVYASVDWDDLPDETQALMKKVGHDIYFSIFGTISVEQSRLRSSVIDAIEADETLSDTARRSLTENYAAYAKQ